MVDKSEIAGFINNSDLNKKKQQHYQQNQN